MNTAYHSLKLDQSANFYVKSISVCRKPDNFTNLIFCKLSKCHMISRNISHAWKTFHSVEKCYKKRSRFLRKNQDFFRQINVFTKEVT